MRTCLGDPHVFIEEKQIVGRLENINIHFPERNIFLIFNTWYV